MSYRVITTYPRKSGKTASTFRLSPVLNSKLNRQLRCRGLNLPQYLSFLCFHFGPRIYKGLLLPSRKPKRLYQEAHNHFMRRDFRPENQIWVSFGQLAAFLNWSRCRLFAVLLLLDIDSIRKEARPRRFRISVQLKKVFSYSETMFGHAKKWVRRLESG